MAGFFTLWAWTSQEDLVDSLDKKIQSIYENRYTSRFDRAASLLAAGKASEGRNELEALASALSDRGKEDLFGDLRARALESLYTSSVAEKDWKGALRYSKALVDYDPKYFLSWLNYSYALDKNGAKDGSLKALYEAYRIAPQSLDAARALSTVLYNSGKTTEAKEVIRGYIGANRATQIYAYYAGKGEAFQNSRMGGATEVVTGRRQTFVMPVNSPGASVLRIDFSGLLDADLALHSFYLITPEGAVAIAPESVKLSTYGLERTGMNTYGQNVIGDIRLGFELPDELKNRRFTAVALEATVTVRTPQWIYYIMQSA